MKRVPWSELETQIASGSVDAVWEGFVRCWDSARAQIRRVLPPWMSDQVHDVHFSVLLKVLTNQSKYDPAVARFHTWLVRIATTTAIDAVRYEARASDLPTLRDPKCSPEALIIERDIFEKLLGTVGRYIQNERHCLALKQHLTSGTSLRKAAEHNRINYGTLRNAKSEWLRKVLKHESSGFTRYLPRPRKEA